ncbi:hypothetical protein E2C01_045979 [Portunus trituberculatus]|uniref:Uncharacterized protein n=1 Tax=Portunus trituberculatus TaxID=210409 RepID=A0A5B7G4J8_PORTR|nr:hypothetical protein [Portunus trituberculatus]
MKSHFSATNKAQGGDWPAIPGSGAAHKLIPPRPENSLEAPDTAGVCTILTAGVTLGSGAALKLTSLKPEKSAEEPETAGEWTPLPPRARLERGATHTLTPLSPENSVEGPGTAGEGPPLATGGWAERGAARELTPLTVNSGAGIGTEGACPRFTPGTKPGRWDTLRLAPLLPASTTESSEPVGDQGSPYTQHQPGVLTHTRSTVRKP